MSAADPSSAPDPYRKEGQRTRWYGMIAFAGVMLFILGAFHVLLGFVALVSKDQYQVGSSQLVVQVSYTGWGIVHIILGIVAAAAGYGLTAGATWARVVAVVVAALSAISNMAFMAAQPFWSTIMIAIDILIIYAVTAHGDPNSLEDY